MTSYSYMYNTNIIIYLAQTTLGGSSTEQICITELPAVMESWIDYIKFTIEIHVAYTLHVVYTQCFPSQLSNQPMAIKRFSDVWPSYFG